MEELSRLRKAVEASRAEWHGPRWRCPVELRKEIVAYASNEVSAGATICATAERLGLSDRILGKWLSTRRREGSGFRPVSMTLEEQGQAASSELVLVSPGGYRVEGLKVDQLVTLLSRLG